MKNNNNKKFNEWLAGIIDGDGSFGITEKKYANCEITVGLEDTKMIYQIQNKFGGTVKLRSGVKAIRYRLQNQEGMKNLIHAVNGNIRTSKRIIQFHRVCSLLEIPVLSIESLNLNNGWFSGYFDSNGMINYKISKMEIPELIISIKNKYLQDVEFLKILGGDIIFDNAQLGCFKWVITNPKDHQVYYEYNKICASRSFKGQRIYLINEFYELLKLKAYNNQDRLLNKAWQDFEKRWNKKNFE